MFSEPVKDPNSRRILVKEKVQKCLLPFKVMQLRYRCFYRPPKGLTLLSKKESLLYSVTEHQLRITRHYVQLTIKDDGNVIYAGVMNDLV